MYTYTGDKHFNGLHDMCVCFHCSLKMSETPTLISLVLVFLASTWTFGLESEDKVAFTTVIYRHGDRTPIDPYPKDPYKNESNWPVGFGQLTPRGKMMQFKLGQYLRNRYNDLLGDEYSENVIYVRSTDVDRTLMSAQSNLAGLYPPKGGQVWNPELLWQPIPVHTVPIVDDNLLSSHSDCPRMDEAVQEVLDGPEFTKLNEEHAWLYNVSIN